MANPLLLNSDDQAFLDALTPDIRQSVSDGVKVDTNGDGTGDTDYGIVPKGDFDTLFPPGGEKDTKKITNGLKTGSAALARMVRPMGWHVENLVPPGLTFTGTTDLLTLSIPAADRQKVDRLMMATVVLSAYTDVAGTAVEFWVDVDGVETTHQKFYFNPISTHMSFGGNWLVPVPAGTATIKVRAKRNTGTGSVKTDGQDNWSLTLWG